MNFELTRVHEDIKRATRAFAEGEFRDIENLLQYINFID